MTDHPVILPKVDWKATRELAPWYHPSSVTNRFILYMGHKCNVDCKFCHDTHRPEDQKCWKPIQQLEAEIHKCYTYFGNDIVDISGGEPTIAPEIMRVLEFCKEMRVSPCLITNGQNLARRAADFKTAGVRDFLISLHGPEKVHNSLMTRPGLSTKVNVFQSTMDGIRAVKQASVSWRTNLVVNAENYKNLSEMIPIYAELKPRQINFIMFTPFFGWKDQKAPDVQVQYSKAAEHIKRFIDMAQAEKALAGVSINVRYMPFCQMRGYEKYVQNYPQHIYDHTEWDMASWFYREHDDPAYPITQVWNEGLRQGYGRYAVERAESVYYSIYRVMLRKDAGYIDASPCFHCPAKWICDGVTRQYSCRYGTKELKPYLTGCDITHPKYFQNGGRLC